MRDSCHRPRQPQAVRGEPATDDRARDGGDLSEGRDARLRERVGRTVALEHVRQRGTLALVPGRGGNRHQSLPEDQCRDCRAPSHCYRGEGLDEGGSVILNYRQLSSIEILIGSHDFIMRHICPVSKFSQGR
jgi:hypothetical protein